MPSPAKKRKLDYAGKNTAGQSKGLEFFFSKQRHNAEHVVSPEVAAKLGETSSELTDEELARKLQAEWNSEIVNENQAGLQRPQNHDRPQASVGHTQTDCSLAQQDAASSKGEQRAAGILASTLTLQSTGMAEDAITNTIPLDEPPLTFEPSKYTEPLRRHWVADGGNACYALLTRCFVLVSGTASRIKIVDTLVNCLRILIESDPSSLLPAVSARAIWLNGECANIWQVWLATNSISPAYISLELGLGGSAISKALKHVCGLDNRSLKAIYDKHGDAGDVAFEAKKKQSFTLRKPKPLTIRGV